MKERKTEKVLDVWDMGIHITAIKDYRDEKTPYRVYANWYDGGYHKKLLAKESHIVNVLTGVRNAYIRLTTAKGDANR